jgi:hypothetical protein
MLALYPEATVTVPSRRLIALSHVQALLHVRLPRSAGSECLLHRLPLTGNHPLARFRPHDDLEALRVLVVC